MLVVIEHFDVTLIECILDRGLDRCIERLAQIDVDLAVVDGSFFVQRFGLPGGRGCCLALLCHTRIVRSGTARHKGRCSHRFVPSAPDHVVAAINGRSTGDDHRPSSAQPRVASRYGISSTAAVVEMWLPSRYSSTSSKITGQPVVVHSQSLVEANKAS